MQYKAVLAVVVLLAECVLQAAAYAQPRHVHPETNLHKPVFPGRLLKEAMPEIVPEDDPTHVHSASNSSEVLRKAGYPVIDEQTINEVFDGEHLQELLEEEVTGTMHVELAVGAIQLPAGALTNPNSAAIDCKGGYVDARGVRVEGKIEHLVCISHGAVLCQLLLYTILCCCDVVRPEAYEQGKMHCIDQQFLR